MARYGRPRNKLIRRSALATLAVGGFVAGGWWILASGESPSGADQPNAAASDSLVLEAPSMNSEAATTPAASSSSEIASAEPPDAKPSQPASVEDEILSPHPGGVRRDVSPIRLASDQAADDAPVVAVNDESTGNSLAAPAEEPDPDADLGDAPAPKPADPIAPNPEIAAARKQIAAGQVLDARRALNSLLGHSVGTVENTAARELLSQIAAETIFSKDIVAGDPLSEQYHIQPGDMLIHIGREYKIPHEALMLINGISSPTRIRAGQKIKVLHGPFHAKIYKSQFRMDVYLQDTFVRSFLVGLGADAGTPEGVWRVKERLPNPTYFPPESAIDKRIIPPNDPTNPLGEHWIGLEGVEGAAIGRAGYGIHGTIDPDSIGKAVSLGCVRMHNDDVAFVYKLLQPGHSLVTILP